METLGQLVDGWIAANDSSQAEFAKRSGVKQNTVSRWVNGQVGASSDKLKLVAPVLGMTYEELLRRLGEIESTTPEAKVSAWRQSIRAQLDQWLTAVGEENEPYFWEYLKAHGDTGVTLIRQTRTAVSADGHDAVSKPVSNTKSRTRKHGKNADGPLTASKLTALATEDLLAAVRAHSNRLLAA